MSDDWRPVPGFPKYEVDPLGQVRHIRTLRTVTPQLTKQGVAYVSLVRETSHQFKRSLALLVARVFIPQPSAQFDTPITLNGDRLDCSVGNLMWRPRWFALQYHRQFNERYYHPILVPIRDLDTGCIFRDGLDACSTLGLLERDLHLSIENHTVAFPVMHRFDYD